MQFHKGNHRWDVHWKAEYGRFLEIVEFKLKSTWNLGHFQHILDVMCYYFKRLHRTSPVWHTTRAQVASVTSLAPAYLLPRWRLQTQIYRLTMHWPSSWPAIITSPLLIIWTVQVRSLSTTFFVTTKMSGSHCLRLIAENLLAMKLSLFLIETSECINVFVGFLKLHKPTSTFEYGVIKHHAPPKHLLYYVDVHTMADMYFTLYLVASQSCISRRSLNNLIIIFYLIVLVVDGIFVIFLFPVIFIKWLIIVTKA